MRKAFILLTMMLLAVSSLHVSAQENEVITNETVVSLLKEGMTSNDIIGLIKASPSNEIHYNISFLRDLKKAGADQDLTNFLSNLSANNDAAKESQKATENAALNIPGIIWLNSGDNKPVPLTCNTFTKEESGWSKGLKIASNIIRTAVPVAWGSGNWDFLSTVIKVDQSVAGRALDFINSSNFKSDHLVLNNPTAMVQMVGNNASNPKFLFRFGNTNGLQLGAENAWLSTLIGAVDNPSDFVCVKLNQKKKERTLPSGISIGSWYNIDSDVSLDTYKGKIIPFKSIVNSDGTYNVEFPQPLEPGEYCFFYKNFKNSNIGRIVGYDFSVH